MRALNLVSQRVLRIEEVADPVPDAGDVVVQVVACGICGTDVHGYLGHDPRRPAPLILGHEAVGIVAEGPRHGERVVINPIVTCMTCEACLDDRPQHCGGLQSLSLPPRQGAFAELVSVPERNLYAIPDGLSFEDAALVEPTAVAVHAVERGCALVGRRVAALRALVLGAGPIGLLAGLVLKARGIDDVTVVEINPGRRENALRAGLNAAGSLEDVPDQKTFTLVIDAIGNAASRRACCDRADRGGVIVHLGLMPGTDGVDARLITAREVIFTGTYCYSRADFCSAIALLADRRLGDLAWVERRAMSDGVQAFADIEAGTSIGTKTLLVV